MDDFEEKHWRNIRRGFPAESLVELVNDLVRHSWRESRGENFRTPGG